MALPAHSGPRPLIQFRNHFSQTVGLLGRVISPSQGRYLHTGQHKQRINAYTHQTFMPWVGFEPTIPASEWAKTVHALDRAATVIGWDQFRHSKVNMADAQTHTQDKSAWATRVSHSRGAEDVQIRQNLDIDFLFAVKVWKSVQISTSIFSSPSRCENPSKSRLRFSLRCQDVKIRQNLDFDFLFAVKALFRMYYVSVYEKVKAKTKQTKRIPEQWKVSSTETLILLRRSKNANMPFAAMERLTEGLCFSTLLTLNVDYFLNCRGGIWIPAVFMKGEKSLFLNNNSND
jgi:hypothetical protein